MTIILQLEEKDAKQLAFVLAVIPSKDKVWKEFDRRMSETILSQIEAQTNGQFFQCERCFDAESR